MNSNVNNILKKDNTVTIQGEKYIKNVEAVQLYNNPNSKWVRIQKGSKTFNSWVGFDSKRNIYYDKRKYGHDVVSGVVGIDGDKLQFADFPLNVDTTVSLVNDKYSSYNKLSLTYCIDEDTALECGYIKSNADPYFYHKSLVEKYPHLVQAYDETKHAENFGLQTQTNRGRYSVEDDQNEFVKATARYENYNPVIGTIHKYLANKFANSSFGLEFECGNYVEGINQVGGISLRDGSVKMPGPQGETSGIEIATCVLRGEKGFANLINFLKANQKRGYFNNTMGLHIHISNPFILDSYGRPDKKYVVTFYKIFLRIQKELSLIIPKHRRNNTYCKAIYDFNFKSTDTIESMFDAIWGWYSMSKNSGATASSFVGNYSWDSQITDKNYPNIYKPWGSQKWNSLNRYSNLNLCNLFWSLQRTIEFRFWPPSFNVAKVMYELIICLSIVHYVDKIVKNTIEVPENLTLSNIFEAIFNTKSILDITMLHHLKLFIAQRKLELSNESKAITTGNLARYDEHIFDAIWSLDKINKNDTLHSNTLF